MKNDTMICQSCSMPMTDKSKQGTEEDGSLSTEYCVHCLKNGSFTNPEATLDEVIEMYAPKWGEWVGKPTITIEDAKEEIRNTLSPLKRWKNKTEAKKSGCCCCRRK